MVIAQQLGKKRLAYPIKKFREGNYVYMELTGSGDMVSALETFYHVNDPIIRFLNVKVEKKKAVVKPTIAEPTAPAPVEVKSNESDKPQTPGAE